MTKTMDKHEPQSGDSQQPVPGFVETSEEQKGNLPDLQVAQGAPQHCHPRPAPPVDTTEPALGKDPSGS